MARFHRIFAQDGNGGTHRLSINMDHVIRVVEKQDRSDPPKLSLEVYLIEAVHSGELSSGSRNRVYTLTMPEEIENLRSVLNALSVTGNDG